MLDPSTGKRAGVFLGISSAPWIAADSYFPKAQILDPSNSFYVVTVRLLTIAQWRDSQEHVFGKKAIAERFEKDKTHHLSTLK